MEYLNTHWPLVAGAVVLVLVVVLNRLLLRLAGVLIVQVNAEAGATVVRTVGEAEASKTRAVGSAEAEVIRLKIASMDSNNYALVQIAEALAKGGIKLVPDIIAGGNGSGGGTLVDVLLANIIRDAGNGQRPLPRPG